MEGSRFSVAKSSPSGILKLTLYFGVPGYGLEYGSIHFWSQLDGNARAGLLLGPKMHPKNIPSVDFQLEICVDSQIVFLLRPLDCLPCQLLDRILHWVLLWLWAHSLPLISLSSLSILQTCSGFHDFTANIPQGCLIGWKRG